MPHTRDLLKLIGITNGKGFAHLGVAPSVIFFLARDRKNPNHLDHRAEMHIFDEQGREEELKIFRPDKIGPVSLDRVSCVDKAKAYANDIIGEGEWSRTPFSNCWIPSESYEEAVIEMERKLAEAGISLGEDS